VYRFVVLIWDSRNPAADSAASRFRFLLAKPQRQLSLTWSGVGMSVFSARPRESALRPYVLPNAAGVVLGCLFARASNSSIDAERLTADDDLARRLANGGREGLIENYWGSYIAFLQSPERGDCRVIRDCSGWLPCFRTRRENIDIVFSDLEELEPLALPRFTLNSLYLTAYIHDPSLQIRDTGLSEVTELLAGDCVEFSGSRVRQFCIWNPRSYVLGNVIEERYQAQQALERVTQDCVNAWAGQYDNIMLSLSGGLDSAIVLGCLMKASARPAITCFNQCTKNTADDERRFARLAAALADVPLIEESWSDAVLDAAVFDIPKLPKPYPGDLYWWLEQDLRNDIALRTRAKAIWTGQGGDHLFWAFRPFPIAADYVWRHGIDRGLCPIVAAGARLGKKSYLSVLRTAITLGRSRERWRPEVIQEQMGHFVNPEALPHDRDGYATNPWVAAADDLPKGKQVQITLLADLLNRHKHSPGAERAYQRHPLQSQPLMELCLSIPTYVLAPGRSRGLARNAFADRVPQAIIDREDKGETSARIRAMIRQNEAFLRDVLLDGILVRERIVMRPPLEAILTNGHSWRLENYWALLACVTAEIWARTRSVNV
jgi:asparagine synthase (glutamine-hydrolysing)